MEKLTEHRFPVLTNVSPQIDVADVAYRKPSLFLTLAPSKDSHPCKIFGIVSSQWYSLLQLVLGMRLKPGCP